MAAPNEKISCARAKLFIVPPGTTDPFLIGVVENFRVSLPHASENLFGIGEPVPVDNVVNNVQGRVTWTRVLKMNPRYFRAVKPQIQRFAEFEAFDVLAMDAKDNTALCRCVDVLPETLDIDMNNGRALRENYNGICRFAQIGDDEVKAAAA